MNVAERWVAVTGHRGFDERTSRLVDDALRKHLASVAPGELVGISCLADGADQLFARAVVDAAGRLIVVVPAAQYRAGLPESCHAEYDALMASASDVWRLDFVESTSEAHMAASRRMIEGASELVAVWDGQPARGHGGTADVVTAAREHGLAVTVMWPDGASR